MIKLIAKIISILSLILLLIPVLAFIVGNIGLDKMKFYMAIFTIVWFVTASMWMWKENKS